MKIIKELGKLMLVWLSSILFFSVAIACYISKGKNIDLEIIRSSILFIFYSCIFSMPAFIFFAVLSILIIQTKLSILKKKCLMILVNYIDIIATWLVLVLISTAGSKGYTGKYLLQLTEYIPGFYPLWVLVVTSTIAILIIPFRDKKTNKKSL